MPSFGDLRSASRMRDLIERIATKTVDKKRPEVRIGRVHSYDSGRQLAWVLYPGESSESLVKVRIALNMLPTRTIEIDGEELADIVRVAGKPGNYYVTDYVRGVPQSPDNIPIVEVNFNNQKGTNVADATDPQDALNLRTGDARYATGAQLTSGLSTKEDLVPQGSISQYYRGDKTWQALDKAAVGLSNVDNTSDAGKPVSSATQIQLNAKAPTNSPTFTGTVSGITKAMVGLAAVDNTSDISKPVSTAQQNALNLKANLASPTFTGTVGGITKAMVGLGSVDNTADSAKPISTATQTALNAKAPLNSPAFTGTPTGITKAHVGLGNVQNIDTTNASNITSGTLPTSVIPPLAITDTFPVTSTAAMLALDAQRGDIAVMTHLSPAQMFILTAEPASNLGNWINITASGSVVSVAGKTGAVSLVKGDVGLGSVDNTADSAKPVSTAQQSALNLKANLNSPTFTGTVNGITKAMVGLASVDNTSDLAKPVSTAQQAALNLKANLNSPTFTGTVGGITKSMVGLAQVDNTSDSAKPVSAATQTALNLKANANSVVDLSSNQQIAGVKSFHDPIEFFRQSSSPSGIPPGRHMVYFKDDGFPYYMGADAVERPFVETALALHPNPSFEDWANGKPVGWATYWRDISPTPAVYVQDSSTKVDGAYSMQIQMIPNANGSVQMPVIPVAPGQLFSFEIWARGTGTQPKLSLVFQTRKDGPPDYFAADMISQVSDATLTSVWTRHAFTWRVPADHNNARVSMNPFSGAGTGQTFTVWLDKSFSSIETTASSQGVEPGTIHIWPLDTLPSGYLPCDGTFRPIADFPVLGALLGNKYGGDGVVNFGLPDLVRRFPFGAGAGAIVGVNDGITNQASRSPSHRHAGPSHTHSSSGLTTGSMIWNGNTYNTPNTGSNTVPRSNATDSHTHNVTGSTGAGGTGWTTASLDLTGGSLETTFPQIVVNYMIKT